MKTEEMKKMMQQSILKLIKIEILIDQNIFYFEKIKSNLPNQATTFMSKFFFNQS